MAVVALLVGFKLKNGNGTRVHPLAAADNAVLDDSGNEIPQTTAGVAETRFSASIAVGKDSKAMGRIELIRKRFAGSNTPIREPEVLMPGACFMQEMIGKGAFGKVHKGLAFLKESGKPAPTAKPVAIKLLLEGKEESEHKADMLAEAYVAAQFVHPNVVSFVGIIDEPGARFGIVFELCNFGSLDRLVELELAAGASNAVSEAGRISAKAALMIAAQVADGMNYLGEVHSFVHRDLACRNVLVSGKTLLSLSSSLLREDGDPTSMVCQVSDFGLSREMKSSEAVDDYYTMVDGKVPIRWSAPESLTAGQYTTATDVWAYGITLYELWVPGEKPYDRLPHLGGPGTDVAVLAAIVTGTICPTPFGDHNNGDEYYPPGTYDRLMRSCWNPDSWSRPTFAKLSKWANQQLNRLTAGSKRASSIPAPNMPAWGRGSSFGVDSVVRASTARTTASAMSGQNVFPPTPPWSTATSSLSLANHAQNIESQIKDRYIAVLQASVAAERKEFANDPTVDVQMLQELEDAENALLDAEADLFALIFVSDFEPTVDGMIELSGSFTRSFAVAADMQKLVAAFKGDIMAAAPAAVREAAAALKAGPEVPATVRLTQRLKAAHAQRAAVVAEVATAADKVRPKFLFTGPSQNSKLPPLVPKQHSRITTQSKSGVPTVPNRANGDTKSKSAPAPKEEYEYMKAKVGRLNAQLDETTKLLKRQEVAGADAVLVYHEVSIAGVAKSEEETKAAQFAALQAKLKMRKARRSSQALPKSCADPSTEGYLNPNLT